MMTRPCVISSLQYSMTECFYSSTLGFGYIVGVGAGPLDLITQRALGRLRRADLVVRDRRVSTSPQPDHHAS